MDTMKAQKKLKPMKSTTQFPYNHILAHSVIALACSTSLLCLFPSQGAFIKHFLFITIPSIWCSFANPKFLFIVVNAIVGFLIFGEYSKSSSLSSSSSSSGDEIYEEYVKRKMELNLREKSVFAVNKPKELEERNMSTAEDIEIEETFEDVKEEEEEEGGGGGGGGEGERGGGGGGEEVVVVDDGDDKEKGRERDDDSEEQHGLPTEELNRRVEAFIARVNKQRWLEAKSLDCCKT